MKNICFLSLSNRKLLVYFFVNSLLAGCTTVESRMSIEPYTKNKEMRNELELIAEAYCKEKRAGLNPAGPETLPDFIFTTDGCSQWPGDAMAACCIAHDMSYWCGGSEQDRKEADLELERCVDLKSQLMGTIFYAGVRLGGLPWLPSPWRWGYGWDKWPGSYEKKPPSPQAKKIFEDLRVYDIIERHLSNVQH